MQSRFGSLIESLSNVTLGIVIGFITNNIVLPLFGYDVTLVDALGIALIFTVISLVRSYVIRRYFNRFEFFNKKLENTMENKIITLAVYSRGPLCLNRIYRYIGYDEVIFKTWEDAARDYLNRLPNCNNLISDFIIKNKEEILPILKN